MRSGTEKKAEGTMKRARGMTGGMKRRKDEMMIGKVKKSTNVGEVREVVD